MYKLCIKHKSKFLFYTIVIYNVVLVSGVQLYRRSVIPILFQILFPHRLLQNMSRVPTSWFLEMKWWPCKFPWTSLELSGPGSGHCTLPSEPFRMEILGGTRQESRWGTQGREAVTASTFPPSICHELLGLDVMIFVYWMLSFSPVFPRMVGEVKWKGKFLLGWDKTRSWEGVERETLGSWHHLLRDEEN